MAITAEQKARILEDFKAGKTKSAAELGKKFGVSRSAVYRVLTAARNEVKPEVPIKKPTVELRNTIEAPKRRAASEVSEQSDVESQVSYSFFQRSEKFADTLKKE